jgi:hypothetical protein
MKPGPKRQYERATDGTYCTGKPCKRGHLSRRYSTGACIECASTTAAKEKRLQHYHGKLKNNPIWLADRQRRLNVARKRILPTPTRPEPPLCECCKKPPVKRSLALDHDHLKFTFRGWLCGRCNSGIGLLGDNKEGVQRALDYLNGNL